ncbi:MAG TPA: radical SAM protein [Myxococcales bacterium]|nr:radical SAM protein [Myxococcales bacterium]
MSATAVAGAQASAPGRERARRLVLVNPPGLKGRTNERTLSGGIGVSRKLKPFEGPEPAQILPIDLLYMAAVAERAGVEVAFVDLLLERRRGPAAERLCAQRIGEGPGTWVGVRLAMPSLAQDLGFADRLKALLPGCTVFVFGAVVMATVEHWIRGCRVDYALFGEPEAFLDEVLLASDPLRVPGVLSPATYVPLEGGDLYDRARNEERHRRWVKVADPAALPRPAWHLLDMSRYLRRGRTLTDVGVYIQSSRGCPIGCTMCPYTLLEGDTWRKNAVQQVVDEIEYLNRQFGIFHVRFRDANFGFDRRYARELADALIARGVKLEAAVETSIEMLDEETLRRMHQAGIRTITTGVETNDASCMESIGQRIKVNDKLRERISLCHRIGFHLYGTYCLGAPEETFDTVEKTWRFALDLDVESGFTVMTPFPGTPMYWRALGEGLLERRMRFSDWNSYTATVRSYALTTTDLDMARWWARMETILPFRRKRLAPGAGPLLGFYLRHVPHYAWREACRAYVWFRRRFPGPAVAPRRPADSLPAAAAGQA